MIKHLWNHQKKKKQTKQQTETTSTRVKRLHKRKYAEGQRTCKTAHY